jgi:hypothetical protein
VRVRLPGCPRKTRLLETRIAADGWRRRRAFFLPEVDDEVLLALSSDVRFPRVWAAYGTATGRPKQMATAKQHPRDQITADTSRLQDKDGEENQIIDKTGEQHRHRSADNTITISA